MSAPVPLNFKDGLVIRNDGIVEWFQAGSISRSDDKPGRILPDGTKEWWGMGTGLHRLYGPAVMPPKGSKRRVEYWFDGEKLSKRDWLVLAKAALDEEMADQIAKRPIVVPKSRGRISPLSR